MRVWRPHMLRRSPPPPDCLRLPTNCKHMLSPNTVTVVMLVSVLALWACHYARVIWHATCLTWEPHKATSIDSCVGAAQALPLPPWRRARSVLSKWGLAPSLPPTARDPPAPLASPSKRLAVQPPRQMQTRAGGGEADANPGRSCAPHPARPPVTHVRGGSGANGDCDAEKPAHPTGAPAGSPAGPIADSQGPQGGSPQAGEDPSAIAPLALRGGAADAGGHSGNIAFGDNTGTEGELKPRQRVISLLARGLAGGAHAAGASDADPNRCPGGEQGSRQRERGGAGGAAWAGAARQNPNPHPAWAAQLPVVRTVRRVGKPA